ncbi:hypothetical protein RIF29_34010 [Crotalaria pallida]|uniref:Uncharacterized protein n=1 Tax=Crotalaria pallida TaxID=3830 RepID=A0AAN9EEC8_CROPI
MNELLGMVDFLQGAILATFLGEELLEDKPSKTTLKADIELDNNLVRKMLIRAYERANKYNREKEGCEVECVDLKNCVSALKNNLIIASEESFQNCAFWIWLLNPELEI